ncbi:hypothetical protein [Pseudomonas sp. S9]|uniref:hypothetical protein n=1 Tax=Pseudomonas sp. S9 TaxID=686578 RepID=UPI0002556DE5|nr:hypothetical protein [Pseudomonas sp. S9]
MTIIDDLRSILDELKDGESERYCPHPETQAFLIGLEISPNLMSAPFVMSRAVADRCIELGMHPDDIIVLNKLPAAVAAKEIVAGEFVRKGKGQRKSGRSQRWGRGSNL